jgi:hypothetical protein
MKMKNLCKFAFLLPALVGMSFLSAQTAGESKDTPAAKQSDKVVTVDKTVFDFGTISEDGGPKGATFMVINKTDAPILITNARKSCGCTSDPVWTKTPIESGKTGTVSMDFDPKGRPGPFDKTVTIFTNSTPDRITVHITGTVQ